MKKVHLLPNVVTAFGLTCGLFIIFKMNMLPIGGASFQMLIAMAMILLLAAFADLLDGAIARAMKAESEFGGMFDSVADAITFGVAPTMIVLKTLSVQPGTTLSFLLTASAMIFSVCGVLRLVRFSTSDDKAKNDITFFATSLKNFTGLPIPAAASALVSANLLLSALENSQFFSFGPNGRILFSILMMIFLGYLMVSRMKFPSLKTFHFHVASFRIVLLTVITAVVVFYGIFHHFAIVFAALSWAYVAVALFFASVRWFYGRKQGPFIEFEPDIEE